MAKVSVIIPVYNTEPYLTRCLNSVCNQTLSDIEIICINDCSTDNSLHVLEDFAKNDNRIKIIDFKENNGAATARNAGINAAQGEYIGFVDSDDYIDLNFYEKLCNKAIEKNTDMAKAHLKMLYPDRENSIFHSNFDTVSKNKLGFIHLPTSVIKASLLKENNILFDVELKSAEDMLFETQVSFHANAIALEENTVYYYVIREGSLNNRQVVSLKKVMEIDMSLLKIIDFCNQFIDDKESYMNALSFRFCELSNYCKTRICNDEVNAYVVKAEKNILSKLKYREEFNKINMKKRLLKLHSRQRGNG